MYLCNEIIMNGITNRKICITTEVISRTFCCSRKSFYISTRIALVLLRNNLNIGLAKSNANYEN